MDQNKNESKQGVLSITRNLFPRGLVAVMWLCAVSVALGQNPKRDHQIEPEDYFTIASASNAKVSPDGQYVVYTELRWNPPDEKRNADLWLLDVTTETLKRLTFDKASDRSAQWSQDSKTIYFASNRKRGDDDKPPYDGKTQVWRIPITGGDPFPVTRVKGGIGSFELPDNGKSLYYTTSKKKVDDDWKELREKFDELEYGHGVTHFGKVWKLDLSTWRSEEIISEDRVIGSMTVTPDQRRVAMITTPGEELIHNEGWSRIDVYDAKSKKVYSVTPDGWRKDHPSPYGWLDSIHFSDDGDALAFSISFDGFPTQLYFVEWMGDQHTLREIVRPKSEDEKYNITVAGGSVKWRHGSRDLMLIGEDHARSRIYMIPAVRGESQGYTRIMTTGDVVVSSYDTPQASDSIFAIIATPDHEREIYKVTSSGTLQRLTKLNPQFDTWKLPQMSIVQWYAPDGVVVEGILELPPDYDPNNSEPLPLVVEIHGGPTAASKYYRRFWIYGRTLMASKGYALLSPNYRGSTGYGDKFLVDLISRENNIEVDDIIAGIEAMIDRGIADPNHLAVMGWSNGGYLTNCLITRNGQKLRNGLTLQFKAASSGAGVVDQMIQWGTEDTPGHVINYMQSLPWDGTDHYRSGSPIYNLHKATTPTVIHVGENDPRVPPAHSRTLYRGLKHYLKVPTELIVYPGEGHGLTTYKHRKAKMEWDVAWFDRYLRADVEKKESPDHKGATH